MAKPGRKTAGDFGPMIPGVVPPPPDDLTAEQQAEWVAITARLPADWFGAENFPLLRELCAHVVYARWVRDGIERALAACEAEGEDWAVNARWSAQVSDLFAEHRHQSQMVAALSTKLRLTKLSQYSRRADAAHAASSSAPAGRKPWEDWDYRQ